MFHFLVSAFIVWWFFNILRSWLRARARRADMARRIVSNSSPERDAEIFAAGIARQAAARAWEEERHAIREQQEEYARVAELKRIENIRRGRSSFNSRW